MTNCRIGNKAWCDKNGCEFKRNFNKKCIVTEEIKEVKIATFIDVDGSKKDVVKERPRLYYWVGNKSGYIMASYREYKPYAKKNERLKYMGWTYDSSWPKKMNTGRLLIKPQ